MENTNKGRVKFFNESKGWGFITDEKTKTDTFFHQTNAIDRVNTDDKVAFDVEKGNRGLKCINVHRIKK